MVIHYIFKVPGKDADKLRRIFGKHFDVISLYTLISNCALRSASFEGFCTELGNKLDWWYETLLTDECRRSLPETLSFRSNLLPRRNKRINRILYNVGIEFPLDTLRKKFGKEYESVLITRLVRRLDSILITFQV